MAAAKKRKTAKHPLPEGWKLVRKSRRLPDGRLRKDYPHEIVINLSNKQMAYVEWVTAQLFGTPEYMAYHALVFKLQSWWHVMPDDFKARVAKMD